MKNFLVSMTLIVVLFGIIIIPTFAATKDNLVNEQWRIFNVKPATASYWDINKVKTVEAGVLQFPIQKFETPATGSFAIYLLNNYNVDLTDKTMTVEANWDSGLYVTRGTVNQGAYARFWFQDVAAGPYDVNDYWWSTGENSLNLNSDSSGELTVSLNDRTLWTNMAGMRADNCEITDYVDWNGNRMKDTPCNGFTKAMKNVKQIGLSFGNSSSYASGVAMVGKTGNLTVSSFTIK